MSENEQKFKLVIFKEAHHFIKSLQEKDRFKLLSAIDVLLLGQFDAIRIKTLRYKIKELIVKRYRLTFFIQNNTVYIVRGFLKKSNKTPSEEIEYAEQCYKTIVFINHSKS